MERTSTGVELRNLRRTFGPVVALDNLNLTLQPGELIALLGPSGCGKTTALRLLAGLDQPDSGEIVVGGKDITAVPASKRNMGMVFQSYSLFPNLTAAENVAFGLRVRRVSKSERLKRAAELLELVGLGEQRDRYPHAMSGGQAQRVALARAIAVQPDVLLLDEPLSALDAKVRTQLRDEIRRLQIEVGITTLFVTHDQEEAMAIADRVGVMRAGNLEQLDLPAVLYARPATPFVASFVGTNNVLPTTVEPNSTVHVLGRALAVAAGSDELAVGQAANALLRPESVSLGHRDGGTDGVAGVVSSTSFFGSVTRLTVKLDAGNFILVDMPSVIARDFSAGAEVLARAMTNEVVIQHQEAVALVDE
ncbi:MAG: ABC transporter ATP-binding protein [Candidatus Nanopelagicales bacterium]